MSFRDLFQPDETANNLFKRQTDSFFKLRVSKDKFEYLKFQELVEINTLPSEVSEFVLSASLDFSNQFEDGYIFHLSLANNMVHSILQSRIELSSTNLFLSNDKGHVKFIILQNATQLLAFTEYLKFSLIDKKILILFEGLSSLYLTQKSLNGTLSPSSLASLTLGKLNDLSIIFPLICIFVNSVQTKSFEGTLREGNTRDPLTLLWKQKVHKTFFYSP